MLTAREADRLLVEALERTIEFDTCEGGVDNLIDEALLVSNIRISNLITILSHELLLESDGIGSLSKLLTIEDCDSAIGTHDSDLGSRPSKAVIATDTLGVHDDIGTAVALTEDDGNLRNSRTGVGVEELCTIADDAEVLLIGTREEAWDILESDDGDVEGVTEVDETRALDT